VYNPNPASDNTALFLAAIVLVAGGIAAILLASTVVWYERTAEAGVIVGAFLFLAWIFNGGLDKRANRRAEKEFRLRIRKNWDLVDDLEGFLRRGGRIFGDDTGQIATFAYATLQAENAVFGQLGKEPKPSSEEAKAAELAQAIKTGWTAGSNGRVQLWGEALRLIQGPARADTNSYLAAFGLAQGLFISNYGTVSSYVYQMRRAHPYRWPPSIGDDWTKFMTEANTFAKEWETYGIKAGTRVQASGPYNLPTVLDLVANPEEKTTASNAAPSTSSG
jgi:hypothetical protein